MHRHSMRVTEREPERLARRLAVLRRQRADRVGRGRERQRAQIMAGDATYAEACLMGRVLSRDLLSTSEQHFSPYRASLTIDPAQQPVPAMESP
jgi:hypothetical protein